MKANMTRDKPAAFNRVGESPPAIVCSALFNF